MIFYVITWTIEDIYTALHASLEIDVCEYEIVGYPFSKNEWKYSYKLQKEFSKLLHNRDDCKVPFDFESGQLLFIKIISMMSSYE